MEKIFLLASLCEGLKHGGVTRIREALPQFVVKSSYGRSPKWRNGIRARFRTVWRKLRVGSSPTFGSMRL